MDVRASSLVKTYQMNTEKKIKLTRKQVWNVIWKKLQSRTMTSKEYDFLFLWFVGLILIPSFLVSYILDGECAVGDWALRQAYIWVAPVLLTLFWTLAYCWKDRGESTFSKIWSFAAPTVTGLIIPWLTLGFFVLANALTGSKDAVLVSGPVIEAKTGYSRGTGHTHYVTIDFQGRNVCFVVSKAEIEHYTSGKIYGRWMMRGGFGYFYNWMV